MNLLILVFAACLKLAACDNYIVVFKDDIDITDKTVQCVQTTCVIMRQNFYADSNFVIALNPDPKVAIPSNLSIQISNLLLQVSPTSKGRVEFNLANTSLTILRSTIKSSSIRINAQTVKLDLAAIEYNNMTMLANDTLEMSKSETYSNKDLCSINTTGGVISLLFSYNLSNYCDNFNPYDLIGRQLFDNQKTSNPNNATLLLISKTIRVEKSTIKGNVMLIGNMVNISTESLLNSQNGGCTYNGDIIGKPNLFVSHSFSCGLNAGSYGGRGGIGIAQNENDTMECIKNGYSRMSVYGNPLMAASSGSTGSPYSILDKDGTSPGAILIVSKNLLLDKGSRIQGGYSDEYKGTPASSGGSVSIITSNISSQGKISANGQSSDKDISGEGGGGRISLYKICWFSQGNSGYNFNNTMLEAIAGKRGDVQKDTLKQYGSYIYAQNGTIGYTPCKPGYHLANCTECDIGYQTLSIFEGGCHPCDPNLPTMEKKEFLNFNDCSSYRCKSERVQLTEYINKYCLTSYEYFSSVMIDNYKMFIYFYFGLVLVLILSTINRKFALLEKVMRKKKKKDWTEIDQPYEKSIIVFAFEGNNTPSNQWFLELDISKDYLSSFILKDDYTNLAREVNAVAKWKKKSKLLLSFMSVFFPPCTNYFMKKGRQAVAKSLRTALENKNAMRDNDKLYDLILWTSEDYSVGQLIARHKVLDATESIPIIIQMSGELNLDDPLTIHLNPLLLYSHLLAYFKGDVERSRQMLKEFRAKLYKINMLLQHLLLHENAIFFCFKIMQLLENIDTLNKTTAYGTGLRVSFIVFEQLKLKYQKAKYRYNQIYHVRSRKYEKIELFHQKLLEFENLKEKFTYQFSLYLTPTLRGRDVVLLNSEKEEFSRQLLGVKNYNYGQSDLMVDLANSPDILSKFIEIKGFKKLKMRIVRFFTRISIFFRTPEQLDLNKVQKFLLKLMLLTLIFIDFFLVFSSWTIMLFHRKPLSSLMLLGWILAPNFLAIIWCLIYQFLYVRLLVLTLVDLHG